MSIGLTIFTIFHVAISLIGIFSGIVVVLGLLADKRLDGWTAVFLVATVATSVTGFLFPVQHLMPSHVLGIISLAVLIPAILRVSGAFGGGLALDLCRDGGFGTVSERVCAGGAAFHESPGAESAGAGAE